MARGWDRFYAAGENPKGLVAQLPNNTTVNAGVNNDMGEIPPGGGDPTLNENIPQVIEVRAHTRMRPANNGPTVQATRRR